MTTISTENKAMIRTQIETARKLVTQHDNLMSGRRRTPIAPSTKGWAYDAANTLAIFFDQPRPEKLEDVRAIVALATDKIA